MVEASGDMPGVTSDTRRRWLGWAAYPATVWALGGTVGLPRGMSVGMNPALYVVDVLAVPLCVVGALLALSLVRPWGRLFPCRLLLASAWAVCALLVVHSAPTLVGDGLVAVGLRNGALSSLERWSLFVYEPWFLVGGILYGAAAWGYGRRLPRPGPAGPDRRCCNVQGETFGGAKEHLRRRVGANVRQV